MSSETIGMWSTLGQRKTRAVPTYKKPRNDAKNRLTMRLEDSQADMLDEMAPLGHRSNFVRKLIEAEYAKAPEERIRA